jgi:hypothetical protein
MEMYSVKRYSAFPNCKEYPLEEIIDYFELPRPYFTCGPDYMLAHAIKEGFKEFYLYGLNMSVNIEYTEQKPGMEFWLGMAMGRGIKVYLQHQHTSLLKSRDSKLYGYFMKQWNIF